MTFSKVMAWTVAVVWMIIIFLLSHQPAGASSELSSGITAFVLDIIHTVMPALQLELAEFGFYIRKLAHFTAYFLLGVLLLLACRRSGGKGFRSVVLAFGIAVLYAMSDEFHQLFIPGRSGEVRDVLIDSAGAMTGVLCYLLIAVWWKSRASRPSSS